jgi:hypothetical protein
VAPDGAAARAPPACRLLALGWAADCRSEAV